MMSFAAGATGVPCPARMGHAPNIVNISSELMSDYRYNLVDLTE